MAKILIAGLLPQQIRTINNSFPGRGLQFLHKDSQRKLSSIVPEVDRVVLMQKFISHEVSDQVPREKRVLVPGGMTNLKRILEQQLAIPDEILRGERSATQQKLRNNGVPLAVGPEVTAPPPGTTMMAPGKNGSRRELPKHKGGHRDWTVLLTAEAGEVFFMPYGKDDQKRVEQRVQVTRSAYKLRSGLLTKQRKVAGGIEIEVLGPSKKAQQTAEPPAQQTAPAQQVVAEPPTQASLPQFLRDFWIDAYLAALKATPGLVREKAAAESADAAVAAYTARFGTA
jgi:hypothetical protein